MDFAASTPPAKETPFRAFFRLTKTGTYGFLIALPLLVMYEVSIFLVNQGDLSQVRVGADVWVKQLMGALGGTGMVALGIVVLFIGLGIFFYERKKDIPIRASYFGWMLFESTVYAVFCAMLVSSVVGALFYNMSVVELMAIAQDGLASQDIWTKLSLSLGAGLYEELVFRVILVGGLFVILRQVSDNKIAAYVLAAIVGAAIFSGVHYTGSLGDAFTMSSFTFRFLFGLALNVIFLLRGFGVAAWTHAIYDVLVVTDLLG